MSKGLYDALDIAKYIVDKCTIEKCPITNLQLQKILYFLQKKYLIDYGNCLFNDEIQAWQFYYRTFQNIIGSVSMYDHSCRNGLRFLLYLFCYTIVINKFYIISPIFYCY